MNFCNSDPAQTETGMSVTSQEDCEEFRHYSSKINKNILNCRRLLAFSLAKNIPVYSLCYNTSLMILQWRKLLWGVDYTVWCFVSKWRCLDCQLKALQCCWNSTDSYRGAYGEAFLQTEKNVDYFYCLGEQLIGQNPNQRGGAEIPRLTKWHHFQGVLSITEHQKNGKEEWSWIRYQTPGINANNEDIFLNYKYHTVLSSGESSPHCQVI